MKITLRKTLLLAATLCASMSVSMPALAAEQPEVSGDIHFEVDEEIFDFVRYDIGTDYEGNPAVILAFDYTNNSEEGNMAAYGFHVQVFQNGIEKDSCVIDYDGEWGEWYDNLTTEIKDGVTITVCRPFLLDDTQTPIDVEVSELVNFKETQEITIAISNYSGYTEETETVTEIERSDTYEIKYSELSDEYDNLQSEYETLQSEYEVLYAENEKLQSDYDTLLEDYNALTKGKSESETQITEAETESNEEYADLLVEYGDIFTEELSVFENNRISELIQNNSSTEELLQEISYSLSQSRDGETTLQNYYEQFDKDRTKAPMGTPIMTLLSYAQSALRQYTMALESLQDYFTYSDQEYIDDFVEYMGKAETSLSEYETLLNAEKLKIQ